MVSLIAIPFINKWSFLFKFKQASGARGQWLIFMCELLGMDFVVIGFVNSY